MKCFLTPLFLMGLLTLNSSCGNPFKVKPNRSSIYQSANALYCDNGKIKETESAVEVKGYLNELIVTKNLILQMGTVLPLVKDAGQPATVFVPYVFSEKVFLNKLREIKSKLETSLGESSLDFSQAQAANYSSKDRFALASSIVETRLLLGQVERWNNFQCSLDVLERKKKDDFTPYLQLKKMENCSESLCLRDKLSQWKLISKEEKKTIEKLAVKMCSSVKGRVFCQAQWNAHYMRGSLIHFYQIFSKRFQREKEEQLHKIGAATIKRSCLQRPDMMTIVVPLVKSAGLKRKMSTHELALLESTIERIWKTRDGKIQIDVVYVEEGSGEDPVNLIFEDGIISHVTSNEPSSIYLNNKLTGLILMKTIAHEFGHILGFRDCYVEFYNRFKREITYYEFGHEEKNLMCSVKTGIQIPQRYFDELKSKICR